MGLSLLALFVVEGSQPKPYHFIHIQGGICSHRVQPTSVMLPPIATLLPATITMAATTTSTPAPIADFSSRNVIFQFVAVTFVVTLLATVVARELLLSSAQNHGRRASIGLVTIL